MIRSARGFVIVAKDCSPCVDSVSSSDVGSWRRWLQIQGVDTDEGPAVLEAIMKWQRQGYTCQQIDIVEVHK